MTDPYLAVAVQVFALAETDLPLPLPLMLGLFTLVGGVVTAIFAAVSKKWRTPADDREDRKIGIEADERLLKRFEDMLAERDTKLAGLEARLEALNAKVEGYQRERTVLIDFIYALVRIIREHDAIPEIPLPPGGIYISGHPSNVQAADADA
jgi:hypothetical protein